MKNQIRNLSLFRAITGKTQITPKAIRDDPVKLCGYMPARTRKIERW